MIDSTLTLRWQRIGSHDLPVPSRAHADDAGLDIRVLVDPAGYPCHPLPRQGRIGVAANTLIAFGTGWAVEIPEGWFGFVVVRSSAGKAGWDIESSGVIDSGYRGQIMLPCVYRGDALDPRRYVSNGDALAQMLILPAPALKSIVVDALSPSARGQGGFGSTGR